MIEKLKVKIANLIERLKEHSWWISLIFGMIGAIGVLSSWMEVPKEYPPIFIKTIDFLNYHVSVPVYGIFIAGALLLIAFREKKSFGKEFDFWIRSEGEQVNIRLDGDGGHLRIWLNVINLSSSGLLIEKIFWTLHYGQFVKRGNDNKHVQINRNSNIDTVLVEIDINNAEKQLIESQLRQTSFHKSLSLKIIATHKGKQLVLEKSFTAPCVEVVGNLTKLINENELAVLNLLAGRQDKKELEVFIFDFLTQEKKLEMNDIHFLISELQKKRLIKETVRLSFRNGMREKKKCLGITDEGLKVLKTAV